MKSSSVIFPILLLVFFQTQNLKAQWSPSLGLEGTHAWDITLHNDSLLFINTSNGIYKRNLSSVEWEKVDIYGCSSDIMSNNIYLFSYGPMCNLMRSGDNGNSWEEIDEFSLTFSMDQSGSVVMLCTGEGTYRSEDYGATWTRLGQYPDFSWCNIFICDSTVLLDDSDLDSLWISYDLGISFEGLTQNGLNSLWIGDLYVDDGELFLGLHDGVFHYINSESKWALVGDSLPENVYVYELFRFNDSLRFTSNQGYYTLNPADSVWEPNNAGLEDFNIWSVDFNDSVIFAGTDKGPFFKENNQNWKSDYFGLYQRTVYQVVQSDSSLFALTEDGLFNSTDNGASFTLYQALNYSYCSEMIITDSAFYLATNEGFCISMDEGHAWTFYNEGLPESDKDINNIAVSTDYIYAGMGSGLYRSLKDPIEWIKLIPGNCNGIVAKDSVVILILEYGMEGLFRSTDYGLTFSPVSLPGLGVPDRLIRLSETDDKIFALAEYDKPYYTGDWGITWKYYPLDGPYGILECVEEKDNVTLLGGLNPIYPEWLLISDDQGNTWNDISSGLPSERSYPSVLQCMILDNRIIAYPSGNSLWYRDDLITSITENNQDEVKDLQIFPNPFEDILNISLPDHDVKSCFLKIYDITGRIVYDEYPLFRSNKIKINTSGFPPGIFALKVQCPDKAYSAKLIKY